MKVLIAEDDPHILEGLAEILRREGYEPLPARDGDVALALYRREQPDFVCLDIMMPGKSGYAVCREIRRSSPNVPIIFISAKGQEIDKVVAFEMGADDFITKPFGVREVVARIRAVTRRCLANKPPEDHLHLASFRMGDLEVIPAQLRARREDVSIDLSLRDVRILGLLHRERGKVLDRAAIFRHAWGLDHIPNSRTLDQHISQLRKRIERDPRSPCIIRTVHGVGYRYDGTE
ncbi:MAG: response regulator transcription factor [Candidatus Sumerlaeia bacterium]|nr:response regulator transcription factor [Candidatus Sumerlaeia bacterium]